ncbi:MAG: Gfo/Idh/MocA family protein [Terriglobia bacterium]
MRRLLLAIMLMAAAFCVPVGVAQTDSTQPVRVGIIGLDTSHVIAFTQVFNDPSNPQHVPGVRVVAAFKGGSPDVEASRTRVDKFTDELRDKWKIEIVGDIPTLCSKVDAVLLESVDGRVHLAQVKPVIAARKPVFIDKPAAASYKDVKEIARLARESGVPWFSTSSLRFWEETRHLMNPEGVGRILGYNVFGPAPTEPHHPDLMWYGIHAVEMLFTLMGPECESVSRASTEDEDVVTGKWKDGRLGVMRGFRGDFYEYGITAFGEKGVLHSGPTPETYRPMLTEIAKFFRTRVAPVPPEETLEIFAFMEAADLSKARGGAAVPLSEVAR